MSQELGASLESFSIAQQGGFPWQPAWLQLLMLAFSVQALSRFGPASAWQFCQPTAMGAPWGESCRAGSIAARRASPQTERFHTPTGTFQLRPYLYSSDG